MDTRMRQPAPWRPAHRRAIGLPGLFAVLQVFSLLAVALNGIDINTGSVTLNFERILLFPVAICLTLALFLPGVLRFTLPAGLYLAWVVSVVIATLLSSSPVAHFNGFLITVAPYFYFLLFSQKSFSHGSMGKVIETFLWFLATGSVIAFSIWLTTGTLEWMIDRGRINFTMAEPNILGATLATLMVMHLHFFRPGFRHYALHAISLLALVLTQSKTPYGAYFVSVTYYLVRSGALRRPAPFFLLLFGGIMGFLVLVVFSNTITDLYASHLQRQDAINNRMYSLYYGWEHFLMRPIFGNGPLDFSFASHSILAQMGTDDTRNLWIWQIWVALLHDEGAVGFICFVAFLIMNWLRAGRMINRGQRQFIGYQAGMISLLVASQATTLHLSALFGITMGLVNSPALNLAPSKIRPIKKPARASRYLPRNSLGQPVRGGIT